MRLRVIVQHLGDRDAAADEVLTHRVDVVHDEHQVLSRATLGCDEALPERDRGWQVGGRQLDHPEGVADTGFRPQVCEIQR